MMDLSIKKARSEKLRASKHYLIGLTVGFIGFLSGFTGCDAWQKYPAKTKVEYKSQLSHVIPSRLITSQATPSALRRRSWQKNEALSSPCIASVTFRNEERLCL